MAITRAQQVRQMLEDGGMLVSPSKDRKRPGYRNPTKEKQKEEKAASNRESRRGNQGASNLGMSPGRSQAQFGHAGHAGKTENKAKQDQRRGKDVPNNARDSAKDPYSGHNPNEIPVADKNRDGKVGPIEKFNKFQATKFTPLRKNTLRNLIDYIGGGRKFTGLPGTIGSMYTDLTGKGLNLNPEEYLGLEGVSPGRLSAMFGQDIVGTADEEKIRDISKVLGQDVVSQSDFEQFYPNMNVPDDRGGPDQQLQETDPCKGPNPPAYCFANQDPTTPSDPTPDRNLGGLAPRFAGSIFDFTGMADGGRIGADEGGIMKASYGYDDAMGEAFEEFLRLKKIKEIPADMEFDEYLDQLDIDVPYSKKDRGEQRVMAQEGGIMDLETGRQMYFLGKLVKKATRAVKKITKSPIGKAAILGGLAYFGGGGGLPKLLGGKGLGGFSAKTFFSKANPLLFSKGELSLGKLAGLSAISPFLFQEEEEEDDPYRGPDIDIANIRANPYNFLAPRFAADGGLMRMGYQEGSKEPVASKTMPLLDMDGKEMDLRDNGGFVPIGRMEKADDVPARLSKNEFVFTADAVRNAGEGDVDKGAEVMYNMMKNLESGGEVSEESQGLQGARDMFQTSKRLEEVL